MEELGDLRGDSHWPYWVWEGQNDWAEVLKQEQRLLSGRDS